MELQENNPWSYVRGFQSYSFCDWPAKISCVVFLGSCNLSCPTCHNYQLAWKPETLPRIPREEIFAYLDRQKEWLEGIVISGGEPTCTPHLDSFLQELAGFGLPIKLDTNGLRPQIVKELLQQGLVQMLAVDLKGPWHKYPVLTGNKCTPEQARNSLEAIMDMAVNSDCEFVFRCTKVPELSPEDIEEAKSLLPANKKLVLQDYIPTGN